MVTVAELLELTLFDDFELISGENGVTNEINNVAILEYESYQKNYDVFSAGDFILTSLFFAKDDPALITEALLSLMHIGVSGIAIKTMFYHELPEKVLVAAQKLHIPIFLFQRAYMEDLILSANELLKSKLQYLVFEEKIANLIDIVPSTHTVTSTAHEINFHFLSHIATVYLTPKEQSSRNRIQAYFHQLSYKRYQSKAFPLQYSFIKYRQGMLLLLSFDQTPEDLLELVKTQLQIVDLDLTNFYLGIADLLHPISQLNLSISQALTANRVCQLREADSMSYSACGIYQMLTPLLADASALEVYHTKITALMRYDEKFTSNLLSTLEIFVQCNGEIAETAARIFQHPNTVRYRLKKISSLWSIDPGNLYNDAFIHMHLYELLEKTTI